jgi:hypothetical protein
MKVQIAMPEKLLTFYRQNKTYYYSLLSRPIYTKTHNITIIGQEYKLHPNIFP